MKIGLIGDFLEPRDEGQKTIAHYLALELSRRHEVVKLDLRSVFSRTFWARVRENPDLQIIHYIPGPSAKSLALCRLIAVRGSAKIVTSAPQPTFSTLSEKLIRAFRPDLVLVQSERWARWFEMRGCATSLVPNGVDTDRFVPISGERRREVRRRLGIDDERFLVLHVGHITPRRNIPALAHIQRSGRQVLMVASEFAEISEELQQLLNASGSYILKGHRPDIEDIYAMSDCYVFPTKPGNTVLAPLSVLEAMSCNVPVISARFEGLLEVFEEGDGLFFADSDADIVRAVERLERNDLDVRTREKVLPCSWNRVAEQVDQLYHRLLAEA